MVEDRITDGVRIAQLLSSEFDGREDPPLDSVAVVNADRTDHASGRMLHFLDVGIDDNRSRCDQRACNLHRSCPDADNSCKKYDHHHPCNGVTPNGFLCVGVIEHFHAVALSSSVTTLSVGAGR